MPLRRKKAPSRVRLTRERVIATALRLLDSEGIEALSMRRLARELGVEAMSLYSHVDSKQTLLAGVLDLALEGFSMPAERDGDWQSWIREWMRAARKIFADHPNLCQAVRSGAPLGPRVLQMIDALLAKLQAAGLDGKMQLRVWHLLRAYLFGAVAQETINPTNMPLTDLMACCPHLVPVLTTQHCCDFERLFEEGLEVILAGTAALGRG